MQLNFKQVSLESIDWQKLAHAYLSYSSKHKLAESNFNDYLGIGGYPKIPRQLYLREYQRQAVANWMRHRGRGTLKMATGSGKTITALAIATELYEKIGLQILIVICPYRHLVSQWAKECQKFNLEPVLAFESVYNWQSQLQCQLYNVTAEQQTFLTIITTNSTFISEGFQSQIKFLPPRTLIVGDEVHNLGSPRLEACLPHNIGLRLGLSATPERYFDEEGTESIMAYFGEILQPEFTLGDAIAKGALVPYKYYPIFVELTESEALLYSKLTKRIGWAMYRDNDINNNETLTSLLMQRSRLVGAAANKLPALRELMQQRLNTSHTLFYCGDGNVKLNDTSTLSQLEAVTSLLGKELGYRVNTYTAVTPVATRHKLQAEFEKGELQGLVAIRCLDEGVDIPAIKNAVILASTSNPRQFIQRRGRILRPYPGKQEATLFDMIVMPPELDRDTLQVEKSLLQKEFKRFLEFAELAKNGTEACVKLSWLAAKYGIELNSDDNPNGD